MVRALQIVASILVTGVLAGAQTTGGAIFGIVRDPAGGVIPGATITVTAAGGESRKVVSNSAGEYRIANLSEGIFRVQVELVGFRRAVVEQVHVIPSKEVECSVILRLSALAIIDYVDPGLAGAARMASAILHFKIAQPLGSRFIGRDQNYLATEHLVDVLAVATGTDAGIRAGQRIHIWQPGAGTGTEDGREFQGQRSPYLQGDEFIGFFYRGRTGDLVELAGGMYTCQVAQGRVRFTRKPVGNIRDGMTVSAFFDELKKLGS